MRMLPLLVVFALLAAGIGYALALDPNAHVGNRTQSDVWVLSQRLWLVVELPGKRPLRETWNDLTTLKRAPRLP